MKPIVVGNWKLYIRSLSEGKKLLRAIDRSFPRGVKADVIVCPPVPLAVALRAGYGGRRIAFGTQDVSSELEGAHTGEISPLGLVESGISHVILGHAERRAMGETDAVVAKKAAAALSAGLSPVICVGEVDRDQDGGHFSHLKKSIMESLARVQPMHASRVVVAYEPVWAIGATEAPAAEVIREAATYVRKTLADMWGRERALTTRIVYGGAVDARNADIIAHDAGVQGVLAGRASVDASEFCTIVKAFSR